MRELWRKNFQLVYLYCARINPLNLCYLTYCRNLRFDERPDYLFLKQMFMDVFKKNNYENDNVYDWNLIAE